MSYHLEVENSDFTAKCASCFHGKVNRRIEALDEQLVASLAHAEVSSDEEETSSGDDSAVAEVDPVLDGTKTPRESFPKPMTNLGNEGVCWTLQQTDR